MYVNRGMYLTTYIYLGIGITNFDTRHVYCPIQSLSIKYIPEMELTQVLDNKSTSHLVIQIHKRFFIQTNNNKTS
jgi:hypothetical protein